MYCLFFNIASHHKSLALVQGDEILTIHETDERVSEQDIVSLGEQLLTEAGIDYADLNRLACVVGPGGFTSLRIAVSYANTLIHQLQLEATGIHLSDFLHAQVEQEDHLWLHATKRTAVFVRGFGKYAELWPEPILLTLDELLDQIPEGAFWCGELLEDQLEQLRNSVAGIRLPGRQTGYSELKDMQKILPAFLQNQNYTPELLSPWYGRGW